MNHAIKTALLTAAAFGAILIGAARADAATLTITNGYANCRSNPGASNAYLGRVYRGESYDVLAQGKAPNGKLWYQTSRGWVCSSFVRVQDDHNADSSKMIYLGNYYVTGYCAACNSPRNSYVTASGEKATVGRTVAMKGLPFGTRVYIEGIGERVVEDRGVGSGKVDVFCSCCADERKITGYRKVYRIEG